MKKSIYSILKECAEPKQVKDRVELLQKNANPTLLMLLKYAFDPSIKFLLPEGDPLISHASMLIKKADSIKRLEKYTFS